MVWELSTHAKCVLAGEHAVLRGEPAIIMPVNAARLRLIHDEDGPDQQVTAEGHQCEAMDDVWTKLIDRAAHLVGESRISWRGSLLFKNNINGRSGLGSSAALCVTIATWISHLGYINEVDIRALATALENVFHSRSSGMDVVGVMADQISLFAIAREVKAVESTWSPQLYLTHTGCYSSTADCVQKVENLLASEPSRGRYIDQKMYAAVTQCSQALSNADPHQAVAELREALRLGHSCFEDWGLVDAESQAHIDQLYEAGASAVKMTGAGGGGYVMSLWVGDKKPPMTAIAAG